MSTRAYDFLDDEVDFVDEDITRDDLDESINHDPEDEDKPWAPDEWKLGSCGCVDYHMADCPTRTG